MNPIQPFLANWQRTEILLLTAVAQLVLLTLVGWLISSRVERQTRVQHRLAQRQLGLTRAAAVFRVREEDPHTTFRRIVTNAVGRSIGEITPLRGSVTPIYLLFREDATQRRLLLAAAGDLKAALRAEGIRQNLLPWKRYPVRAITPLNCGAMVGEEIEDAWAVLADRLGLPAAAPPVSHWALVDLPAESAGFMHGKDEERGNHELGG